MGMISKPLVSVVTPVYNDGEYFEECIESVLSQTYENWEYIIVNNCSTDGSLEIANKYAKIDSRIKIYDNTEFLAQLPNFNHALRQISNESKYCKMVLADDWIFPECLKLMTEVAEANETVGIVGAYRLDDVSVTCDGLPYPSKVIKGAEVCRLSLLNGIFVFGSPTSILYRSDIVRNRNPFFNESSLHADTEACYEILQTCDFGFVHQVLTFTRRENESISTLTRSFDPYYILDKFIVVNKFGNTYLNTEEFKECLKLNEQHYYNFLAQSAYKVRTKEFWRYQKKGLQTIGYRLNRYKLLKFILIKLLDNALNPKRSVGKIIKIFSGKHE